MENQEGFYLLKKFKNTKQSLNLSCKGQADESETVNKKVGSQVQSQHIISSTFRKQFEQQKSQRGSQLIDFSELLQTIIKKNQQLDNNTISKPQQRKKKILFLFKDKSHQIANVDQYKLIKTSSEVSPKSMQLIQSPSPTSSGSSKFFMQSITNVIEDNVIEHTHMSKKINYRSLQKKSSIILSERQTTNNFLGKHYSIYPQPQKREHILKPQRIDANPIIDTQQQALICISRLKNSCEQTTSTPNQVDIEVTKYNMAQISSLLENIKQQTCCLQGQLICERQLLDYEGDHDYKAQVSTLYKQLQDEKSEKLKTRDQSENIIKGQRTLLNQLKTRYEMLSQRNCHLKQ